jgi:glutathione S-transferase
VLKLFFAPGSSSMAPHIALHEIGRPFESQPLSFAREEHRTAEFLAINPEAKLPVLVVNGPPLTEVAAILFYLAKRFPEAGLMPSEGIEAEAQTISWMSFIASTSHPARRKRIEHVERVYEIADHRLGKGKWAVRSYSIADIHLFRLYWRVVSSLAPEVGRFPSLDDHYQRMMARAAVQRTLEIELSIGYQLPA